MKLLSSEPGLNRIRLLRNDENIVSSISVTDIVFYDYFGKWNTEPFTKWKLEVIFKSFLNRLVIRQCRHSTLYLILGILANEPVNVI